MTAPIAQRRRPQASVPSGRVRRRRRARVWRGIWSAATTLTLVLVALFAVLAVVVPAALGAQTYTVLTSSMAPTMPPGTLIGVAPADVSGIEVGDVVTYQARSGDPAVVTHRVIGVERGGAGDISLRTRGDANDTPDARPVIGEQIRGVVVYAVPVLGYPGSLLGGGTRSLLVIAAGAAIIAYGVISLLLGERRRRRLRSPRR